MSGKRILAGLNEALSHAKGETRAKQTRLPREGWGGDMRSGSFIEGTRD